MFTTSCRSIESATESEIDKAVARMREGLSLYQIDEKLLRDLDPDLILTQDLCQVCAPSGNEVSQVFQALPHKPEILWLTPKPLAEIFENVRELGRATGSASRAEQLVHACQSRLEKLRATADKLATRPRVFCMEWIDPIYASGHWVPEMVGRGRRRSIDGKERIRCASPGTNWCSGPRGPDHYAVASTSHR